jgi:hypothetical protein
MGGLMRRGVFKKDLYAERFCINVFGVVAMAWLATLES